MEAMQPQPRTKLFIKAALITALIQAFIFFTIFIPLFAVWGFPQDLPFRQNYMSSMLALKEIMFGFLLLAAATGGIRALIKPHEEEVNF